MPTSDRPVTGHAIGRLLREYQRQLLVQTGLLLGLGAGCAAALSWRLWRLGVRPSLICGIGLAALAVLAWWQRRAFRRVWTARTHTPLALDRALGLEARLITAAEFADLPQPPPLYAQLMEDPALVRSLSSMRLSPVADRRTGLLAVALLLLFFWPWRAPLPPQLAKQPPSSSTPPETPPPPQADPSQSPTSQPQQSGSQQQQQQSSGGSAEHPQSQQQAGGGQSGTSSDRAQSESGRANSQGEPTPSSQQSASPSAAQPQHAKAADQQPGQSAQEQTGPPAPTSEGRAGKAAPQGSAPSQQGAEQAKAGQEKTGQRAAQAQPARPGESDRRAGGAGSQQLSAAQQEALKADIQQMLQQLSTELHQMQAELQQQHGEQPNPAPGTSTDPELFEDASRLAPAAGEPLPVQLDVDTQPTSTTRRGGGIGKPSTEAVDAPFQAQSESAELAEPGPEAPAGRRQAIPPEYRPVFERLSRTNRQPTP